MENGMSVEEQEQGVTPDETGVPDEQETAEPVEGDDGDQGDGDEGEDEQAGEPPAEPAQPASMSPEQFEKRATSAETRFKTYASAIGKLYEEDAQYLTPCPLCPDQHKGFVDVRHAGRVPKEIQDAIRMYFGIAREQDYAHSQVHRTCPQCEGKGKVATGSNVPEHATVICPDCGGRGYVGPQTVAATNGHAVTGPTVLGLELPETQARDDVDEWNEPRILPDGRENPNFGRMPNRKILVEPYGVTAGLNALSGA